MYWRNVRKRLLGHASLGWHEEAHEGPDGGVVYVTTNGNQHGEEEPDGELDLYGTGADLLNRSMGSGDEPGAQDGEPPRSSGDDTTASGTGTGTGGVFESELITLQLQSGSNICAE